MIVGADVMFAITTDIDVTINNPIATNKVLFILGYPLYVFLLLI